MRIGGGINIDNAVAERFGEAAKDQCLRIAEEVVAYIRSSPQTPTLTGTLRMGYEVEETPAGAIIVNHAAPYWRYVEFGTLEHGDAQRHVRPAMEAILARHAGGA